MLWDALSHRRLAGLLTSLNRQHATLERILRALERDGVSTGEDPLYRHLLQAADEIAAARFLLRTKLQPGQ